jgi:hypothetical protein
MMLWRGFAMSHLSVMKMVALEIEISHHGGFTLLPIF